jgi:hypothetical protein
MKAHYLLFVLLFLCFSCGTTTVSDSEKEKIEKEVKEQIQTTIKALESVDPEALNRTNLDSPDFRYGAGGKIADSKIVNDFVKQFFGTLINQKGEITNEKIWVLDKSTALYVAESKWTMNFKDGRIVVQEPWVWESLLKKVDGKWQALYVSEFGKEKFVPNPEKQKELNQIELHKQYIGSWKVEAGKDTTFYLDIKPYGNSLEGNMKFVSKGKIVSEGKQLWDYDKTMDRFIVMELFKGMGSKIYSSSFTSKTKCVIVESPNAMYPDNAQQKWEIEIQLPQSMVENYFVANKLSKTSTYQRIK